jgi:hypothetical protein
MSSAMGTTVRRGYDKFPPSPDALREQQSPLAC